MSKGLWRLGIALSLAVAAELLAFFAPETMLFKGLGMTVAVAAIGLAGLSTYKKGVGALLRGHFNINALMAVAVAVAFAPRRSSMRSNWRCSQPRRNAAPCAAASPED